MRVSRLPRRSLIVTSGRSARIWQERLGLPVPTTAPGLSPAGPGAPGARRTSRGSSRSGTQAIVRPSGCEVGRSLRLCTATSTLPASNASSISLTKTPFPPIDASERSRNRSPEVWIISTRAHRPASRRRRLSHSACHSARRLPRLPLTRVLTLGSPGLSPGGGPGGPVGGLLFQGRFFRRRLRRTVDPETLAAQHHARAPPRLG